MTIEEKTPERLQLEDAVRQALEKAARRIEQEVAGDAYMRAFTKAARLIREMKPT
jgi:hypothetical protein